MDKEKIKAKAILVGLLALAIILPGLVVAGVVGGTAIGIGSALQIAPANCKAPPNIFDAWETLEDFITGVDCSDECEFVAPPGGEGDVDANKAEYVQKIIGTGKAMKVPDKGIVIALTTALVESNLKNYANDGQYDTSRNPSDATLGSPSSASAILSFAGSSIKYPHDAVGSDATSVGLFQQQAWWGTVGNSTWETDPTNTMKRLMDPVFGAQKFFNKMLTVNGWESMPHGQVAQKVQVSAFPDAYNGRVQEAQQLFNQYKDSAASVTLYDFGAEYSGGEGEQAPACGSGGTGILLDKSSMYQVTAQWAHPPTDYRQGRVHAGMDIDCDNTFENVYAPLDAVVTIAVDGNASGSGYPAGDVFLKTADGTVLRFHHLREVFVEPGSQVTAGTPVAECANTGNSFGTHLHFEADISESSVQALHNLPTAKGVSDNLRDPALVLDVLGVDICPPYTANRKTVPPGASLPTAFMKCWPPEEWVK